MRKRVLFLLTALTLFSSVNPMAHAAISGADAKYAQEASKATQSFSTAIGNWGDIYQTAPQNVNSSEYKSWIKKAATADASVKSALTEFSKIKVSSGYKKSDAILRKFIKAYSEAISLYAPAIKKNDQKLVKKANDAILKATTLFTDWGNEFTRDTSSLAK